MNDVVLEEDATASVKSPETPEEIIQLQTDRSKVQIPKFWAGMAARSHYMTPPLATFQLEGDGTVTYQALKAVSRKF